MQIVRLNKEFKALKYLLLNNNQQKSLDFISNLKINQEGFGYDDEDFLELMDSNKDRFEILKTINKYLDMKKNWRKWQKLIIKFLT